jgi:hypothetical protein
MRKTTEIFLKVGNLVQITVANTMKPQEKLTAEADPEELIAFLQSPKTRSSFVGTRMMILEKIPGFVTVEVVEGVMRIKSDPIPADVFRHHLLKCPTVEKMLDLYRE